MHSRTLRRDFIVPAQTSIVQTILIDNLRTVLATYTIAVSPETQEDDTGPRISYVATIQ
jgi:hypothetical protein